MEDEIAKIAKTVHHGGKKDFCVALALNISGNTKAISEEDQDGNWDGCHEKYQLEVQWEVDEPI